MMRRVLLVVMATVMSYALSAGGGYFIYTISTQHSEMRLSQIVRFIVNPLIVLVVGGLVGFFSKDHPILTALIGLAPWAAIFYGHLSMGPILDYLVLGAITALVFWRLRNRFEVRRGAPANVGVTPG